MKKVLIFLLLFGMLYGVIAQTASTDPHWTKNTKFSDEFDGNINSNWRDMEGPSTWGSETFRPQNIGYGIENEREFIRFVGEMENGVPYTGGIKTGRTSSGHSGLGYGYYEVEARLLQMPNIISGLWPTFWLQQGSVSPPCWYEELDIFEPINCQVRENNHHVTYWNNPSENCPNDSNLVAIYTDHFNVDMSQWHKYAVEWLEGRVTFYLDDEPFWEIQGQHTPFRQDTNLRIDLQTDKSNRCYPSIYHGLLGYYDVNYFRYYQLKCSGAKINEILNFNEYCYVVKEYIRLSSATTIPAGENISLRASDFIELHSGFEVPLGRELYLDVNPCSGSYFPCPAIREGENEE